MKIRRLRVKSEVFRFPRLEKWDSGEVLMLGDLRKAYPPPKYDPKRDGAWDPAEYVLSWLLRCEEEKLREKAKYHGLCDEGTKSELIKRLYLHWRASKLNSQKKNSVFLSNFPFVAYGPGFERVEIPECSCGKTKVDEGKIRRFPRIDKFGGVPRFPRMKK